jgi:hypothetical protein
MNVCRTAGGEVTRSERKVTAVAARPQPLSAM